MTENWKFFFRVEYIKKAAQCRNFYYVDCGTKKSLIVRISPLYYPILFSEAFKSQNFNKTNSLDYLVLQKNFFPQENFSTSLTIRIKDFVSIGCCQLANLRKMETRCKKNYRKAIWEFGILGKL